MHVQVLEYIEYPDGNKEPYRSHSVLYPSWEEIEAAIRRLDQHRFPFLFLWPTTDEALHEITGACEECEVFEVMGGEGGWWLAGTFDGYFQRRIDYPERGEQEVDVWTSDQGFADAARHICRDIEAVIRAAHYYAEQGGFDPSLSWE